MNNIIKYFNRGLEIVCIFIFAFIVTVGTYQIVTRYVFNSPSTTSEELLTYSFTWLALLSASLVFGKREHMAMTFLYDKMPEKSRRILSIVNEALVFIFSAIVLIYGGISITKLTATQVTASLGIPMSYVYTVVPLSGFITAFYSAINIIKLISKGGKV